jgi:hypothetical protein
MKTFLITLILFIAGCGALVPSTAKRTSSTSEAAASTLKGSEQFSKIVTGQKTDPKTAAEFHVGGLGNKVSVTIPKVPDQIPAPPQVTVVAVPAVHKEATQAAQTQAQQPYREEVHYSSNVDATDKEKTTESTSKSVSIPLGVNLILLAIGMLAVIFAINRARNSSLAVNALYQTFDSALAGQIRSVRERAILSTDNQTISMLNAQIADLEAQRGRLAR